MTYFEPAADQPDLTTVRTNAPSYRERLNKLANRAPRITLHSAELIQADTLAMRKARAAVYARNNPNSFAVYNGHNLEA